MKFCTRSCHPSIAAGTHVVLFLWQRSPTKPSLAFMAAVSEAELMLWNQKLLEELASSMLAAELTVKGPLTRLKLSTTMNGAGAAQNVLRLFAPRARHLFVGRSLTVTFTARALALAGARRHGGWVEKQASVTRMCPSLRMRVLRLLEYIVKYGKLFSLLTVLHCH